jgi:beta-lactamase regulating signal transducer with metallopeptidase domain/protocatechuate 3,4-dioxygenase beta subunit
MTTLLDYSIRMSVVLALALLGARLLRRQSAAMKHLILAAAMLVAAVLPIFNRALPPLDWNARIDLPVLKKPIVTVVPLQQSWIGVPTVSESPIVAIPQAQPGFPPPTPSQPIRIEAVLRVAYLTGTVLSVGVLLLSLFRLARIGIGSRFVEDARWKRLLLEIAQDYGLRRPLCLLESQSPSVLATWGLFRPKIVIPSGALHWTEDRIRVVLGHELAHVRRRDWPVQLAAEVFRAVFWFNPLVWMIRRRLRQESEHACDDAVLNRGVPAPEYAAHLLELARSLGNATPAWAPALLMARPSTLEQRFEAMLNPRLNRGRVSCFYLVLTFGAFLCVALPLAALRAAPQAAAAESLVRSTAVNTANTVRSAVMAVLQVQSAPAAIPVPNSIEGIVVRLGTSDAVSDVDVELRRVEGTPSSPLGPLVFPPGNFGPGAVVRATYPNPSDIANVRTKSDGRFIFTNLKPGTYRLQAARAGGAYYPAEYGQRTPRGKGYDFEFVEGQVMRDVRLPMAPTGVITGRVRDADGQPAARVRVMALEATYPAGERKLGIIQAVQTDDKGEYRLFWLPPGQYVIAARPEDPRRQHLQLFITPPGSAEGNETYTQAPLTLRTLDNGSVVEETFQEVYYGGDPDVKKARSVDLPPGGNVGGIDLSLAGSRVRTRHVRGTLLDPSGARVPGVTVSALPRSSGPSMVAPTAITDVNGTFDLAGVGTGAYVIRGALPGFAGFAPLGPGDADAEGLTISMSLGVRVQGKISVEGRGSGALPDLSRLSVQLQNSIPGLPGVSSTAINGDAFSINAPQVGDYRVFVNPIMTPFISGPVRKPAIPPDLQNAYVKAIRLNADDGLNGTVNVAPRPGQLEIVIALNGGIVEGVVNDRQQPAPNATVVLVPAVRSRIDLYRIVNSGGNGRYRMQGIPPGDYRVFAWEYIEDGTWFDSEFTRTQESKGKPVRITEGNTSDLSLTMERP